MHHPSTDKSHFSPSHHSSLKNALNFHNTTSQDRTKAMTTIGNQENCNASPLKNVYFSHYESENINSIQSSKNFVEKGGERPIQYESKPNVRSNKALHLHPNNYLQSYSSGKFQDSQQEHLSQHNGSIGGNPRSDSVMLIKEKYRQQKSSGTYKVKPEKGLSSDCKYQKRPPLVQEYKNSEMFNIPTSVLQHAAKIEPKDKYFLPSCSSAVPSCMAPSYATSGPFFVTNSDLRTGYQKDLSSDLRTGYQKDLSSDHLRMGYQKDLASDHLRTGYQKNLSSDHHRAGYQKDLSTDHLRTSYQKDLSSSAEHLRTSYQNSIYQNSCSLGVKPWHYSDLPAISLDSYFRAPEAARPPPLQNHTSALHEGLISIAQTAPQVSLSLQSPLPAKRKAPETDDDVQIIGVQTKHASCE